MRKKAGIVCVALLVMLFAFSSCTQIVWVPVPDGPGISGSGKAGSGRADATGRFG